MTPGLTGGVIVLASGPPRRRQLLETLGLPFGAVAPALHEALLPGDRPAAYVTTGEALDKAGAYAMQGKGAALVEGIRADCFGVMGLPLRLALGLLARFGVCYRFTR